MPKIAIFKYLVFYIVSYDLLERYHLHVIKSKGGHSHAAKIWLGPVEVFEQGDLTDKELNLVIKLLSENEEQIKENINKFAKGEKIKPIKLK